VLSRGASFRRWRRLSAPRYEWFQALAQAERSTVRVPKTPSGMDQQAQRRTVNGLSLQGPALKIQPRRTAKRIERHGTELLGDPIENPLRPSVEGIGETVIRLRRAYELRPLFAPSPSEETHRQRRRAVGEGRHLVIGFGVERASPGKALLREPAYQFLEGYRTWSLHLLIAARLRNDITTVRLSAEDYAE
jgi:hypothetical protein